MVAAVSVAALHCFCCLVVVAELMSALLLPLFGGGVHVVAVRGRQYVGWQCVFTGSKLVDNLLTGSVLTGSVLTGSVVTGSGLLLLLSGGSHCLAVLCDCCCWSGCRVMPHWRLHAVTCHCRVAASACGGYCLTCDFSEIGHCIISGN